AAFAECARALVSGGRLVLVLNHPAFRIPKESSWGWDEKMKIQYRRVDRYLSELRSKIMMHPSTGSGRAPGRDAGEYTVSFHRPLQYYFKALQKNGFMVSRLEEWESHRKSEKGPRAEAEDRARKEIPMFLCLEAVKK
ncbi:MAG: SAM-dependent methyltransferase, partial [Patescibacteria group bacterium]|nr:SAM-dependent methyltransferase [Patescibacteria group bacterium]